MTTRRPPLSFPIQFIAGFIVPTVILLAFSDESRLGPLYSMILALSLPAALEVYSFLTGRKIGWISLISIVGILLIGVISLFGLSEEWLGVRRAAVYAAGAIGLLVIIRFKPALLEKGLGAVLDLETVFKAARRKKAEPSVRKRITVAAYWLALLLAVLAVWSYLLTVLLIDAPTGSSEFNAQYAELRLLSIPYITLPFFVGLMAVMMYVGYGLEKLSGLEFDQLVKKKPKA